MKAILAEEIEQRGLAAVDELIDNCPFAEKDSDYVQFSARAV